MEDLRRFIRACPIIDHHCHPILERTSQKHYLATTLLGLTTEASGSALVFAKDTLAHHRGVKILAGILGCEKRWEVVAERLEEKRADEDVWTDWVKRCWKGVEAVCVDDGLVQQNLMTWRDHVRFLKTDSNFEVDSVEYANVDDGADAATTATTTVTNDRRVKRIVRIETLAEDLLMKLSSRSEPLDVQGEWSTFGLLFKRFIRRFVADDNIAGFKSVVAYRSGLNIEKPSKNEHDVQDCVFALLRIHYDRAKDPNFRLRLEAEHKPVFDYIIDIVCTILKNKESKKPFQFHTGLGDVDLTLKYASPSYLQPLIKAFPEVNFVMLHSGYPFHREAAYLTLHSNVFLDIGEIFPVLSKSGQKTVVKEVLELASWGNGKLMWSTDGHYWPETYLLAIEEMREVVDEIVVEMIDAGDITLEMAFKFVKGLLWDNANELYGLHLKFPRSKLPEDLWHVNNNVLYGLGIEFSTPESVPYQSTTASSRSPPRSFVSTDAGSLKKTKGTERKLFDDFIDAHPTIKYIRFSWLDYTSTLRCRIYPVSGIQELMVTASTSTDIYPLGSSLRVLKSVFGLLQNDHIASDHWFNPTMESTLVPYFDTLHSCDPWMEGHASVLCGVYDIDQLTGQIWQPLVGCPLDLLNRAKETLDELELEMAVGFEIEVVFIDESKDIGTPLDDGFGWATSRGTQGKGLNICEEVYSSIMRNTSIKINHFHRESAPGQYEIVLGHTYDLRKAVAGIIHVKEAIYHTAKAKHVKATWHPKPFATTAGTGAHLHVSCRQKKTDGKLEDIEEHFVGGILHHIPSLLGVTLPHPVSWNRVSPTFSAWSGSAGGWVSWGINNRETSIRKCGDDNHYEFRLVDGLANPILVVALLAWSVVDGFHRGRKVESKPCDRDPATFTGKEAAEHNLKVRIPSNAEESLESLAANKDLIETMNGKAFVEDYLAVKKDELKHWNTLTPQESDQWIITKY